ncbi:hypothetical protein [Bradyrhizobium sp. S3.9.1]|uniref:hypothetical protein n=1 Tax=Bradyrhizobium sp. S3.9.1 TaxID=3156431 RepID=UPI003395CE38
MKPHRPSIFGDAVPVGPGHRLPMTLLYLRVRDCFLRAAMENHCGGMSHREAAEWLHKKLARYSECAWRRDYVKEACPPRLAGHINALMWCVLKCGGGRVVSERTIRRVLSANRIHGPAPLM